MSKLIENGCIINVDQNGIEVLKNGKKVLEAKKRENLFIVQKKIESINTTVDWHGNLDT
jgi:hypothetical protein